MVAVAASSSTAVPRSLPEVFSFALRSRTVLAERRSRVAVQVVAVLGPKLKRELFGDENALGKFVRVGGQRLRVIGIMAPKGQMLGFDIDDAVYIPVATAMRLFNMDELLEIDVAFAARGHDRSESSSRFHELLIRSGTTVTIDFSLTTQAAMLDVFGRVMDVLTFSVAIIAGISLAGRGHRNLHDDVDFGQRTHQRDRLDACARRQARPDSPPVSVRSACC